MWTLAFTAKLKFEIWPILVVQYCGHFDTCQTRTAHTGTRTRAHIFNPQQGRPMSDRSIKRERIRLLFATPTTIHAK